MNPSDDPRKVLAVTGSDREKFLQGLVTNDVRKLGDGPLWTALLTPQGKYLCEFFLWPADDAILIDAPEPAAEGLARRLSMYRLRADVQIAETALGVRRGTGPAPQGARPDPRSPALGWRQIVNGEGGDDGTDWAALRVAHRIPAHGIELIPEESYILEMGFEALGGVDFRKGCYVGQEVTARMKHKTELRKGLARVRLAGEAAPGTPILAGDRPAGRLCTVAGDLALAYLRFDRIGQPLQAGTAQVTPMDTAPPDPAAAAAR